MPAVTEAPSPSQSPGQTRREAAARRAGHTRHTHQMRTVFPFLDSLALRFSHNLSVLIRSHELFTLWLLREKFNVNRRML